MGPRRRCRDDDGAAAIALQSPQTVLARQEHPRQIHVDTLLPGREVEIGGDRIPPEQKVLEYELK